MQQVPQQISGDDRPIDYTGVYGIKTTLVSNIIYSHRRELSRSIKNLSF